MFALKTNPRSAITFLGRLLPVFYVIGCWELCSLLLGTQRLPDIWQTICTWAGSFLSDPIISAQGGGEHGFCPHVLATVQNFLRGFLGGITAGFLVAIVIAQKPLLLYSLQPVLEFLRVLPPLLVIPFMLLFFQSSEALVAFTVAVYTAFSTFVYTLNALQNIRPNYVWLAHFLGAGRVRTITDVQIPAVMPELLGGLRVVAALGLGIAVVVEYMAAPMGIGRVMKYALSYSRIDLIMVGTIWVVLIAFCVDSVIQLIFKFILRWTERHNILGVV
jgi:ABC-type nitrate/sulfonate/bicarbonate transport system permease component